MSTNPTPATSLASALSKPMSSTVSKRRYSRSSASTISQTGSFKGVGKGVSALTSTRRDPSQTSDAGESSLGGREMIVGSFTAGREDIRDGEYFSIAQRSLEPIREFRMKKGNE